MRKKLGELLVEAGAVTAEQVGQALAQQRSAPEARLKIGEVLVRAGVVSHRQVGVALATQYDLPFVELPEIAGSVSRIIPIELQAEHGIVPFRIESDGKLERVHVAVADPSVLELVDELRFQLGKPIRLFVAAKDDLDDVIAALKGDVSEEFEIGEEEGEDDGLEPGDWVATAPGDALSPLASPPASPPASSPPLLQRAQPPPLPTGSIMRPPAGREFDDLLGELMPASSPLSASGSGPTLGRVEVVKFSRPPAAAAAAAPAGVPPEPAPAKGVLDGLSDEDLKILEDLERMAQGEAPLLESEKVRPAQMVAALIRLLIRKDVIGEADFLEELGRK